ncbi:small acid-soluble spore protein Tlp [Ureibacillus sp. GCM10028918]|uniref:small acid-soluble spore protein Tlp n=1 Tax=Ureibacillus sp. GCM10028918 TaxID=3273429 RepID=UPI003623F0E6
MPKEQQPNPDNRYNNVERLHDMIENTKSKLQEAEISMEFASPEERQQLQNKNARRKQSIEAMESEMQDESEARKNREY